MSVKVSYAEADKFVANQQKLGSSVRWDGWALVFFIPAERAIYTKQGVRYNGKWGFQERVEVDALGNWSIPKRYVRTARRTRN